MANEFDNLDDELPPEQEFSDNGGQELIASGSPGTVYDWSKAPDGVKAPPRKNMNGMVVKVKKVELIIPPVDRPWVKTKKGDKDYKYCSFVVHYDYEGQQEYYSGVRVFKRLENGKELYSHPTIMRDGMNQSSKLLGLYATFKKKDINEISLREFMAYLNSGIGVKVKTEEVMNPGTNQKITKNLIGEFI